MKRTGYELGRFYGRIAARYGEFRPQDLAGSPDDVRQGYVDGWEDAWEAAAKAVQP